MSVRRSAAIAVGKAAHALLRATGHGATSLPGKLALGIAPDVLRAIARSVRTIVVTGTNGKTTTAHIIAQALRNTGHGASYNRSGANLVQGIVTEFVTQCSLSGKPKQTLAVIECDEAALKDVCLSLDPQVIIVTNVFRDQLDRYGEVTHTKDAIVAGLRAAPNAHLCLNADDPLVASMAAEVNNDVSFFGVSCEVYATRVQDAPDVRRCFACGTEYEYSYRTFAHLGGYRCPVCSTRRPEPDVAVRDICNRAADSCTLEIAVGGEASRVHADVPAGYDTYNCCATVCGLLAFGFKRDDAFAAIAKFEHGFGRTETFDAGHARVTLMLVKNPTGCNQVINLLLDLDEREGDDNVGDTEAMLVCILNDQDCDGADVSWIYDAAFEALSDRRSAAICSGSRAEDMALRLKYAGMPVAGIRLEKDTDRLLDAIEKVQGAVTVMANYSAMLEFRAKAAHRYGLSGFWEG